MLILIVTFSPEINLNCVKLGTPLKLKVETRATMKPKLVTLDDSYKDFCCLKYMER